MAIWLFKHFNKRWAAFKMMALPLSNICYKLAKRKRLQVRKALKYEKSDQMKMSILKWIYM